MQRVVCTGIGVTTSIGLNVNDFWSNLISGKSGISKIESFDTSKYERHYGGEIKNFTAQQFLTSEEVKTHGRGAQLALASAIEAFAQSGLKVSIDNSSRYGVSFGTTMGEPQVAEEMNRLWIEKGIDAIPAQKTVQYPMYTIPDAVAKKFKLGGRKTMIPNACAAGNFATAYAFDLIKTGKQDMLIVGGSDPLSLDAFTGFCRLGAVAPQVCRPFDKDREGMMVAEGAGALVLESLEHAQKRGAKILAEIIGVGISSDAHHITAPKPDGEGLLRALQNAVNQAHIIEEHIDYYCAHGTGTQANDSSESAVVSKFFKSKKVPVSSIKSALGHTMGAASAIANVACVMALQTGVLPPTTHFESTDPDCDIDVVSKVGRKTNPKIVVNSALAFGGNNAVVIWKKY